MQTELLRRLCCEIGVSGDESRIRELIISEIKNHVDEITVDKLGNIIVFKKGKKRSPKKILISAHMDEVGFMVTHVDKSGFLNFSCVGGINEDVTVGQNVLIGDKMIPGIIGRRPIHFLKKEKEQSTISFDDMYIDIGATSKENAMEVISLGDYISFESFFEINGEDIVRAKALDDRAGCLILIDLLKQNLPIDIYFAFLVQEEVGARGAKVAAYQISPDIAFVVECTTACDIYYVLPEKQICKINSGPVISFMDQSTVYDRDLCNLAINTCEKEEISFQIKRGIVGGNDASSINVSRAGVKTLALSVPCRYLHSSCCLASLKDIEQTELLISKILEII